MLVIANLPTCKCAKNYQNRAWFDKVIAKIKWCSFLTHVVHLRLLATKTEYSKTRKRAIAKALQLKGHSDFAPVDLAYYQHFLGFLFENIAFWQPQMQVTWRHASCQQ